ncbi:hypothetical protein ALT_8315 [Aspergillus lentulus]|uniref:Uncharacterized protein n=1 Tax=Aspergillus lentulus TaxID=293939 RepID=A0AAN4PRA1_ASPLE|nr:uncharacterized protein IFM58399_06312 [Aspergillus lentulus]KAF4166020.1 hypothetical protein CNMCM6936_007107 [Aspergillus lentulus]KAF4175817.1 hypothetical protein CNMCM8060_006952 [Aspergillus lentulus]KAF4179549.1 hypothetical protein CNMCM7927_001851 [Aspergillus lentulus]KAF4194676.1 hypothetical protein CNMCM8694_007282 [Aspergillus lentulus]KAF4204740.1 hypothetical protein CNMCM8927_007125 [Aspergillus lentulus]
MSEEAQPITLEAFAEAIKELPLSAVYAKVSEIRNSVAHLRRSNSELRAFIDQSCESESDKRELEGYIAENEGVITTMNDRLGLLKTEIENRGERWIEEEVAADTKVDGDEVSASPSSQPVVNGTAGDERPQAHQDATRRPEDTQANEEEGVYL